MKIPLYLARHVVFLKTFVCKSPGHVENFACLEAYHKDLINSMRLVQTINAFLNHSNHNCLFVSIWFVEKKTETIEGSTYGSFRLCDSG